MACAILIHLSGSPAGCLFTSLTSNRISSSVHNPPLTTGGLSALDSGLLDGARFRFSGGSSISSGIKLTFLAFFGLSVTGLGAKSDLQNSNRALKDRYTFHKSRRLDQMGRL